LDENGWATAVVNPGEEKWLSLFAEYQRVLSDPRLDGAGATVQFNQAESFVINVVQGAESVAPASPPALRSDQILLADIHLVFGQTQVLNADIDVERRQDAFRIREGLVSISVGQAEEAAAALALELDSVRRAQSNMALLNLTSDERLATALGSGQLSDIAFGSNGTEYSTPQIMACGSYNQVVIRTRGGQTWTQEALATVGVAPACLAYDPISQTWVAGLADGTAEYSTDGGDNWAVASTPPPWASFVNLTCGNGLFVTAGANLIYTTPTGDVWTARTSPLTPPASLGRAHYGNGIWVLGGCAPGPVGKVLTSANGLTWIDRSSLSVISPAPVSLETDVIYDPYHGVWIMGSDNQVQITTNPDSIAWIDRTAALGLASSRMIRCFATDGVGTVAGLTWGGTGALKLDGLIVTRDGGTTWDVYDMDYSACDSGSNLGRIIYALDQWWIVGRRASGAPLLLRSLRV
jgi:hypothetical protein